MEIHLPIEIAHYEGDLRYFVDSMVRKLFVNREKGFAENLALHHARQLLNAEIKEFDQAVMGGEAQFAAYMETADIANMAFLLGLVITRMNKKDYKSHAVAEIESPV